MPCDQCGSPAVMDGYCRPCISWAKEESERQRLLGTRVHRFFENRTFLGEYHLPTELTKVSDTWYSSIALNTAYFCPHCGDVWARQIVEPSHPYEPAMPNLPPWTVETRRCPKHGDGYLLSQLGDNLHYLRACSPSLLQREALLLCLHHSR